MNTSSTRNTFLTVAAGCLCGAAGLYFIYMIMSAALYSLEFFSALVSTAVIAGAVLAAVALFMKKPEHILSIVGTAVLAGALFLGMTSYSFSLIRLARWHELRYMGAASIIGSYLGYILMIGGLGMMLVLILLDKKKLPIVKKLWFIPMAALGAAAAVYLLQTIIPFFRAMFGGYLSGYYWVNAFMFLWRCALCAAAVFFGLVLRGPVQTAPYAPRNYQQAPYGYQQAPQNYQQPPYGYQQPPQNYQAAPQNYQQAPYGYQQAPQNYQQAPYGYQAAPQDPGRTPVNLQKDAE